MKTSIVADSSALFSLIVETDRNYQIANKISKNLEKKNTPIIVPGEVFTELLNILGRKINHQISVKTGQKILEQPTFVVIDTSPSIRINAFDKFQKQPKSVSFTDCLVMAFADEFETKDIFGFDEAFFKNGYKRIGIDK